MFDFDHLLKHTPVVLMVGGVGARLRPLTDVCPKPLLKIGGVPLLQRTLESLIRQGFRNFYLSVNYKAEMIEEFFGTGRDWEVNITYLRELEPMGTAGSLKLIVDAPTTPVVVMNGDLFSEHDLPISELLRFHTEQRATATMTVVPHEVEVPFGVVEIERQCLTSIVEKPTHVYYINAGMYVLEPSVLPILATSRISDMPAFFSKLISLENKVCAYHMKQEWIDIGTFETFERVNERFEQRSQSLTADIS
jgi:NDP-sugar pyrophosphorylase family protein